MKNWCMIAALLLMLVQGSYAAGISLRGTVRTALGTAVAGAAISLAKVKGVAATTDSLGKFTLSGTGTQIQSTVRMHPARINLSNDRLTIVPVLSKSGLTAEFYSASGARYRELDNVIAGDGSAEVLLPLDAPGISIMRITINGEATTRSVMNIGSRYFLMNHDQSAGLLKRCAPERAAVQQSAVDTIMAVKTGFAPVKQALASYQEQNLEIVLQEEVTPRGLPPVYDKEHTGADCSKPPLPEIAQLPTVKYLTDPFEWSDKSRGRMKTIADWRCRRAEIVEEIMKYETGNKPPKPEKFEATLSGNTINITCGVGSNTIKLSATISRPSGAPAGPIPAIINPGSLTDVFSKRGIAKINFSFESQLTGAAMNGAFGAGNFVKLYPNTDAGYMIRWAWGVSRVIDALQMLPEANVDTKHLAISGCSYQGKFALYSGTFDERIALTIPHESGGGGTISWRYSDMLEDRDKTEVENLHHAQGAAWYSNELRKFPDIPDKLPFDQHELMALCAPRALFCIESSKIARMGAEAARLDAIAARKVYAALGIEDRIGVTEANVDHCSWASSYTADLEAFVDKYLLDKKDVNTKILRSKFTSIDTATWIPWEAPKLQ